ncbi:T9SS type A sorting domain-containing protein [candidate division WOR-3 bacterium]|uniref:T9SS type A sorting domain-containing protein n=1 Tax=candidate division WOR-3 bacterium TaxID=2052148 RepID=A0A9D5QCA1_UNCW3|nr:T9SS type A sorting domain-containing protein [candidate division WOR-3 bacterium]MBD3364453.1 T9SS type A sorting domain-containing protein [candidate division WOR-3 bacterium]
MMKHIALSGLLASALLWGTKLEVPVSGFRTQMQDPHYRSLLKQSATTPTRVNSPALEYLQSQINVPETMRVLAIRVEFPADEDSTTWGNGKMDLAGFGSPSDGLGYDPPHDRTFFENQMLGLRNFYLMNSRGRLVIEYDVYPEEPFGAYQVPQKMAYYGDSSNMDRGLTLFMRDALLAAAEDPDIDFSDYQYLSVDDTFDMIIIFHAGSTVQASYSFGYINDLASATVTPGALQAYTGLPYVEVGDVRLSTASILPESPRVEGYMVGLPGLLYHEFTHLLGGYDLYDVSYYTQGLGAWGLMGGGGWLGYPPGQIPSIHDAYHRYMFGWEDPIIVTRDTTITLYSAEFDTLGIEKWQQGKRPTTAMIPVRIEGSDVDSCREYFLIENRQSTVTGPDSILVVDVKDGVPIWVDDGEYDAFQPGAGIIIWHVDEDVVDEWGYANYINAWVAFGEHNAVDMEEADGIQDYELLYYETSGTYATEGSAFDPFFAEGGNPLFSADTKPSSEGYYGETGITVEVLDTADTAMRIKISFGNNLPGFPREASYIDNIGSVYVTDLDDDNRNELLCFGSNDDPDDIESRIAFAWEQDGTPYGETDDPALLAFADIVTSPPAAGDVDADGRIELVVLGANGYLSVYDPDTLVAGSFAVEKQEFPLLLEGRTFTSPMLTDLDGDGSEDILAADEFGNVYAYNYRAQLLEGFPLHLGEEIRGGFALAGEVGFVILSSAGSLYGFDNKGKTIEGFPVSLGKGAGQCVIPPLVADVDGDGEREILLLVREYENYRYIVVSFDGSEKYRSTRTFPSPVTSPALADVNKDGLPEVIFGSANGLWALDAAGAAAAGYPVVFPDSYTELETIEIDGYLQLFDVTYPFTFTSSPVIGDFDADEVWEIAIGAPDNGIYIVDNGARGPGKILYTRNRPGTKALAAGDLDGNGRLDLVAGAGRKVHVWRQAGTEAAWSNWMHDDANTGLVTASYAVSAPPSAALSQLYVYPNPARTNAYLHVLLGDIDGLKIQLIDITGKLQASVEPDFYPGVVNDIPIEGLLTDATPGLYIVRVEASLGSQKSVKLYKLGVIR